MPYAVASYPSVLGMTLVADSTHDKIIINEMR
jgi:hypothetical protein